LLQVAVPRDVWQGSFLKDGGQYALMGTTVAPGFDGSDYEAGQRRELVGMYPEKKELIIRLTPG
jgi:predicted cupin superfamily sugar epimerase